MFANIFKLNTLIVVALSALIADSAAAEFKVATVDVNKILNESKEAKQAKSELDKRSAEVRKKVDAPRAELQALETKLREAKVAENSKEAQEFRTKYENYSKLLKESDEELRKEFMKTNRDLTDKAIKVIEAYAKENGIDLVLDHSEKVRGAVLYGSGGDDITDKIISEINS